MSEAVLHLSSLVGSPLLDSAVSGSGRVEDLIARLDTGDELPPVTGLKARIGGRELFVPADRIERLEPQAGRTSTTKLNLAQFERRPGEVLLRRRSAGSQRDQRQDRAFGQSARGRAGARGGDVARRRDRPGIRRRARRLLPRRFRAHEHEHAEFVPWPEIEPFVGHVPSSRLRLRLPSPGAASSGADRRPRRGRLARGG